MGVPRGWATEALHEDHNMLTRELLSTGHDAEDCQHARDIFGDLTSIWVVLLAFVPSVLWQGVKNA